MVREVGPSAQGREAEIWSGEGEFREDVQSVVIGIDVNTPKDHPHTQSTIKIYAFISTVMNLRRKGNVVSSHGVRHNPLPKFIVQGVRIIQIAVQLLG